VRDCGGRVDFKNPLERRAQSAVLSSGGDDLLFGILVEGEQAR